MKGHVSELPPCPFLPSAERVYKAVEMKTVGASRGEDFYLLALTCAQSLWLQGLPAQSLLLMNRAFSSDLQAEASVLSSWPLPYAAMHWVMSNRSKDQFIGNPRRHFQHLATRMVPPRKELRSWRAWACWRYACEIFTSYPADEKQIQEEGIVEPTSEEIFLQLGHFGLPEEASLWQKNLASH